MSLNYKNATTKGLTVVNDEFTEVKKNKTKNKNQVNINSIPLSSYNKDYINEIINDNFELEYSNSVMEAKIDFEDVIEKEFYLKTKYSKNLKSKSLYDIIKYHSSKYYQIKQDVHKNKSKYL